MKNLKIRTKLLATFMLVIILFIGTVAIAIYGLQANANKYSEFYNVEYKVTNNIMSMRRGLQIIVKDLAFITIESDESKKESYQDELQTELTALEENAYWLFENFYTKGHGTAGECHHHIRDGQPGGTEDTA